MAVAKEERVEYQVVLYHESPISRSVLVELLETLDGPVENLVRKDPTFKALGLRPENYIGNKAAVTALLLKHPKLMQRPVLVRGGKAIIGRPKERIADFLRG